MRKLDYSGGRLAPRSEIESEPVFFDPSRKRWTGFLILSISGLLAGVSVLGAVSASIVRGNDPIAVALQPPALESAPGAQGVSPVLAAGLTPAPATTLQPEAQPAAVDPVLTAAIDQGDAVRDMAISALTPVMPDAIEEAEAEIVVAEPADEGWPLEEIVLAPALLAVDADDAESVVADMADADWPDESADLPLAIAEAEGIDEPAIGDGAIAALPDLGWPDESADLPPEMVAVSEDPAPLEATDTALALAVAPQREIVAPVPPMRPVDIAPVTAAIAPATPRVPVVSPSVQVLEAGSGRIDTLLVPNGRSSIQTLPAHRPAGTDLPVGDAGGPGNAGSVVEMIMGAVLNLVVSPANAQEFPAAAPATYAFHVNWDAASLSSLHENVLKIDTLLPEWLHLTDAAGGVAFDQGVETGKALALIGSTHPGMRIVPVLTDIEGATAHADRTAGVLSSATARAALARSVAGIIAEQGFSGVAVRFSDMERLNVGALSLFMRALKTELGAERALYGVLPMADGLDHGLMLVEHVDAVIVEGWGETRAWQAPGPIASQGWFADHSAAWQALVAPEQLVFALGNLAYRWNGDGTAASFSVLEAFNRARAADAPVALDAGTLNSRFRYEGGAGGLNAVWMLDAVSAFNQLGTVLANPPRGIALHRLGTEDAAIWPLLTAEGARDAELIAAIDYDYQISHRGRGEVIRMTHEPVVGRRLMSVADDTIIGAEITEFPRAYEIVHWGADDQRVVALTFDDGPDPAFTPQILDVLSQYGVPATFFSVGAQMLRHPEIVQRMVDEGHEVGNHTYSHTNISNMSPEMLRIDLNATQRVFESITGRHMAFFRAPYAVDANPTTPSEIAPLSTVGELGYLTVNMNIDPRDWWAPNAERIASATIRGVETGLGKVVLLHDGGGDRSETVRALPRIIEDLEAQGYRFVAISELIGLDADAVMPVTTRPAGWLVAIENVGLGLLRLGEQGLVALFFTAIALGIARSVILIVLSMLRRRRAVLPAPQRDLKVGVIVPAYNEEKVILKTIESLLGSTYSNIEIIVVDDGSKDRTFAVCQKAYAGHPKVRVHTKPNGGKAAALNFGFARTSADVVVALDADTVFKPDTIGWLAAHFRDPAVAAVAGNAKVGNRINLLTRWQAVEYITAQNLDRRAFEVLNCITVVPGAVGAWRRSAVVAAGGYRTDTLAEDADLTLRLLRAGHRVAYEERAIAFTEAPESVNQLFKQRFRWMFGMLQVAYKHKDALRMGDSRSVALVALPNILVFQILFPLVAPIADIVALITLGDLVTKLATNSNLLGLEQTITFLALFFAFMLLDLAAAFIAFCHERREDWRLLLWLPFQRFYYRQLLYIVAIKAVLTAIQGTLVGWGNLARTASVRLERA